MEMNLQHQAPTLAANPNSPGTHATPPPTRPRCSYVSRTGKPCRYLAVSVEKGFCKNHLPPPPPGSPEELAHTLEKMAGNFDTPEGVNHVMYVLFFALVQGKISERKAGILTYMAQTILHSHRAIAMKQKLEPPKLAPPYRLTWNLPPRRELRKRSAGLPVSSAPTEATTESPEAKIEKNGEKDAGIKASTTDKNAPATHAAAKAPAPSFTSSTSLTSSTSFTAPPPSPEEIARRNRQFDRKHGFTRRGKQSFPEREAPDWKIMNGR